MPSISKNEAEEMMDNVNYDSSEEEELWLENQRQFLENTFVLEDYLSCDQTRKILYDNHRKDFDETLRKALIDVFNDYKVRADDFGFSFFRNDREQEKETEDDTCLELIEIVYDYIEKEYDLDLFYNDPILAKPLVILHENRVPEEKKRVNIVSKKFNWATKTYVEE